MATTSTLSAAPVSAFTTLDEEKRPKYWFFTSVADGSKPYPRMRPLPNQFIPYDQVLGTYLRVDEEWNVKCSRAIRSQNPVGSIFVSDEIEIYKGCYNVEEGHMFPLGQASREMREHYENYLNPVVKPKVVMAPAPSIPKTGSWLDSIKKDPRLAPPKPESGFYIDPQLWYYTLCNIMQKENSILTGPTGCGKTVMVSYIAQALDLPLSIIDFGAMHDPIAGLLGTNRLKKKKTFFDYSRFSEIIQQRGIVLMDEINRPQSSCNNIIFPLTDGRRELPIEIAGSTGVRNIKVHPECVFIATANLGNEYTGTNQIDRGLLDRFTPLEVDYMPKAMEQKVLVASTGIDPTQAKVITDIAEKTRIKAREGEISTAISHRYTQKIAEKVKCGFPMDDVFKRVVLPLYDKSEHDTVKAVFASA